MANTLDRIEISPNFKILRIREITDSGGYHRRALSPDMDISGEVDEVQDKAEELWTNEVKDAFAKHEEEQEVQRQAEQEAELE